MTSTTVALPERPMNQTQLKNLQKLVDGDFGDLQAQVSRFIRGLRDKRLAEIQKKYEPIESNQKAQELLNQFQAKMDTEMANLGTKLAKLGFRFRPGYGIDLRVRRDYLEQVGLSEEQKKINQAAQRVSGAANDVIGAEHRKVNRVVLLQGVTGEKAQSILDAMPSVESVMEQVKEALTEYQEDLNTLNGN